MSDKDIEACRAAIAALEGQRGTLGDSVVEMATAPLRQRLAALQRPTGLQRRQLTVLFADVVGSTAMAQGLDAEDTLAVLSGALRRMAELVAAHQGRVLRFTGDGLKAAFGMDEAREDDAERAVRAGLAILAAGRDQADAARRLHGIADFAVRVGVHTGDVAHGGGVEADNTAMGAAVNIAARMEQSAPPGGLRISNDTFNQVRGLFDVQPQPPLQVKGVEDLMKTYLVHAAFDRSRASVERGLQGLSTPMVGRGPELLRLQQDLAWARETRQLQALTLLGDAGLGKSRLLREWLAALEDCRVITVRSQPDSMLRPWGLLRSLLAVQFGVADTDSAEVARGKVEDGLSPWFDERGQRQAQLIGQLSGLDFGDSPHVRGLDPRSLRDQALAALRGYLQGLAKGQAFPVLIVEDLHWADDGSLDLLQDLLAHAAELPLVLIMTGRPGLLTRRPDWGTPDTIVQLTPLAAAQSDELAQALLQRVDKVPAKLTELIVGRAEGNPYYMEELVRRLIDDEVIVTVELNWTVQTERLQNVRLPGTLVGLLQARLDALPTGERQAARQASVIGHIFWDDALTAVDGKAAQALPALQRAAFVKTHETSDFTDTVERQFDHHLLHQVTYDTLLKAERRLGHGAVARWLTERTQGRGAEFLAMTGDHAERAGDAALAVDCFGQAAIEALKRFANRAAMSYLRRAVALLGEADHARRIELLSRLNDTADILGDRAAQDAALEEMAAILERHPDDARHARLCFSMALLADRRSDTAASERLSRQAFELAERSGAAQWAAMAQGLLAWLHHARQDHPGAMRHLDIGLPWAGRIEAEHLRAETEGQLLTVSAMVSTALGHVDNARLALTAVLSRGEALSHPRLQLGALSGLAIAAGDLGRWDESITLAERMRMLAESVGATNSVATAQTYLAVAANSLGDFATAMHWLEQGLTLYRAIGNRLYEATTLRYLCAWHLQQGDAHAALQWCAQAQAVHQTLDESLEACVASAYAALCEMRLGRAEAAMGSVGLLLARLNGDMADRPAFETLLLRWLCHQALEAAGDARAAPLLAQLHADVLARANEITDAADCGRLIQALPVFRGVVAAHANVPLS
ncbi:ATP-binding protein [Roseateles sp. P5_E7]